MIQLLVHADRLLHEDTPSGVSRRHLAALVLAGGIFYGGVMGTFGGMAGERAWMVFFSAIKVPLLLLATFAIALPSFFVLNTLLGVRGDFALVVQALLINQAGLAVILAALAPYTALWYLSSAGYNEAILFNGFMFATASLTAQWLLRRCYQPLVARNRRHRLLMRIWSLLYVFVGIQMGWILRPFIGDPSMPVQFFRADTWDNAYVIVARMLRDALNR